MTLESIDERYPRLDRQCCCEHPGIGFVLVRSAEHGAIAIGADGVNYLDGHRVEGEDPLLPFGPTPPAT